MRTVPVGTKNIHFQAVARAANTAPDAYNGDPTGTVKMLHRLNKDAL